MSDFETNEDVDLEFEGTPGEVVETEDLVAGSGDNTEGDEFAVEEVGVEAPEGVNVPGVPVATVTKPKAKKVEPEIPAEEFMFDATPKPREPKDPNAPAAQKGAKQQKHPLPEGWVTPTQLVKILLDRRIVNLRPQAAFGLVKNGKNFPYVNHSDGRYIVPLDDGMKYIVREEVDGTEQDVEKTFEVGAINWIIAHFQRKAERDAERAKKAAETQANVDAAADSQPEVGGEGVVATVES